MILGTDHDIAPRWLPRPDDERLDAFRGAVTQAEKEFRSSVGDEIATVVTIGLEAYTAG